MLVLVEVRPRARHHLTSVAELIMYAEFLGQLL